MIDDPVIVPGDADGSGTVDAGDALLVLRYALGIINSLPFAEYSDVNGDGSIDSSDALIILRYALGIASL